MYSGGSDVEPPTGPAAEALILPHWLDISESAVHSLATEWKGVAGRIDSHGNALRADRDVQAEFLDSDHTGEEHRGFMTRMMHQAFEAADLVDSRAVAAADRAEIIHSDKTRMKDLAEIAQADWDSAEKSNVPGATAKVIATYAPEVAGIRAASWERFNQVPPLKPAPRDVHAMDQSEGEGGDEPKKAADPDGPKEHDGTDPKNQRKNDAEVNPTDEPRKSSTGEVGSGNSDSTGNTDAAGASPVDETRVAGPGSPAQPGTVSPGLPVSPLGSGGGMPGGSVPSGGSGGGGAPRMPGGGLSGLGSSFKPPATPSVPSSAAGGPTSPAQVLSTPLTNASSSFQSGVASGMGASGAVPPPASAAPPPQPLAPFENHPAVANAVPASTGFEPGAAPAAAAPAGGGSAPTGGGLPGGAPMGGGGVMPPPIAGGAAPAAPYSAAGAGAAGIAGGATSPAAGSPAPAGAGSAPAAQPSATPMVAGGSGSATASSLAAASSSMNPDVVTARQVLEGLVKGSLEGLVQGSHDGADLIVWAVSVLRTPAGPQTVVASSVGGGAYIPARVFLPVTARLATADRILPIGWAAQWMGWKSPVDIVIDHAQRFMRVAAGVRLSAIATCDLMATRPARQVVEDFVTVHPRDILLSAGPAPGLDGSHHHRLTALDPGLAARIAPFNRGGEESLEAGAGFTAAVIRAAMDRDETGKPLANDHDAQILDAVSRGVATVEDWQRYDEHVKVREDGGVALPSVHGPRDVDESDASRKQRSFYSHLYRVGRIVELVKCWEQAEHINVADVAYSGVAAGYAPVVMATLATLENGGR